MVAFDDAGASAAEVDDRQEAPAGLDHRDLADHVAGSVSHGVRRQLADDQDCVIDARPAHAGVREEVVDPPPHLGQPAGVTGEGECRDAGPVTFHTPLASSPASVDPGRLVDAADAADESGDINHSETPAISNSRATWPDTEPIDTTFP